MEEQQERNNTLVEVNKELRQQLDVATENSDKLLKDVNRLGDNWEKLNRELLEKEKVLINLIRAHGLVCPTSFYLHHPSMPHILLSIGVKN